MTTDKNNNQPSFGLRHRLTEREILRLTGPELCVAQGYQERGIGIEVINLDDFSEFPAILVPELVWSDNGPHSLMMVAKGTMYSLLPRKRSHWCSFRAALLGEGVGRLYTGASATHALKSTV